MSARTALAIGAGLLITLTVALAVAVVSFLLLAIWGDPSMSDQWVATAFVAAFAAIATGGAGAFMVVAVMDA